MRYMIYFCIFIYFLFFLSSRYLNFQIKCAENVKYMLSLSVSLMDGYRLLWMGTASLCRRLWQHCGNINTRVLSHLRNRIFETVFEPKSEGVERLKRF